MSAAAATPEGTGTAEGTGTVPPARVLLIGMMGVGKTTVGQALAHATGWPHLDNDELVRRATGTETAELFRTAGVPAMREAESAALTEALREPPPVIAGVAAGVVHDPADRARLRTGGFVVWLRATIGTLARRVGSGEGRAWLQPDPQAALRRLYEGREPLYAEVATLIVDVDDSTPEDIAALILRALETRS
jgi:shikimate kinase